MNRNRSATTNRRSFIKGLGASIAGLSAAGATTFLSAKPAAAKPNIILIMIDDMGWRDVGFMGSKYYETPNIDKLARQGMIFTNAYANGPNCAPTRACLISGQYTPRHGVYTVDPPDRGPANLRKIIPSKNNKTLQSDIITVAEALKPAGYTSASMGKWHLGNDPQSGPIAQGFDVNVGGSEWGHPKTYFSPYKNPKLADGPKGEYLTDRLTDEALKFIEANRKGPFFLYLPHYAVHTPIQAKADITAKYKDKPGDNGQNNAKYAAMVESVDLSIGRIVDKVDALKIAENTMIIFYSDNGGVGGITTMTPLRGSKGMLYEGGIREPMAVRWPGTVQAGTTCNTPVISVDFYPTFVELAGASTPNQPLDGESIVPLITGKDSFPTRNLYWHFPAYLQGYTERHGAFRTTPAGAIRKGDWKLIEYFDNGVLELYNLKDDIGEKNNLAKTMPEKTEELLAEMKAWRKELNAPVPVERNPLYDPTKETKKKA